MRPFPKFFAILDYVLQEPKNFVCNYSPPQALKLMLPLMSFAGEGTIIEIGTDTGLSAMALALMGKSQVHSFDINEQATDHGNYLKEKFQVPNVFFHHGTSFDVVATIKPPYELVFIDGDHDFHCCLDDINNLSPHITPLGTMLLHDYNDFRRTSYTGVNDAARMFLDANPEWSSVVIPNWYLIVTRNNPDTLDRMRYLI